ncbi:hypothetical protein [Prevotella denticola]|jgi:hypothetical protein|nr:hypothetical protein [Prevotella denticola]
MKRNIYSREKKCFFSRKEFGMAVLRREKGCPVNGKEQWIMK